MALADPIGRYQVGVVATPGPPGPSSHIDTYPIVAGAVVGYHAGSVMTHPAFSGFSHPGLTKR